MKKFLFGLSVLLAFGVSFAGMPARANTMALETFLDFETASNPQISPDGRTIIYSRRWVDQKNDRMVSTLWIMNADGTRSRQLTQGSGAMWSPDGTRIAFVKQDANKQRQIHVRWMDAQGSISQITRGEYGPRGMAWSPDGKSIAFVARVPNKSDWTIKLPARPKGAKWADDPNVFDKLHYRQDRVGLYNQTNDHLFVVTAEGGTARQLTSGDWNVGARGIGAIAGGARLSWSPDSKTIAFDGNKNDDWEKEFFTAHIYTINVKTADITQLTTGKGFWSGPKFSPNGRKIAYTGYNERILAAPFSNLWTMEADGSTQRQLTQNLDDSPQGIRWAKSGAGLYFTMSSHGHINLYHIINKGAPRAITTGAHVMRLSSVSDSGVAVATKQSIFKPSDIVRFNIRNGAQERQLTHVNDDIFDGMDLGSAEKIWYDSSDGVKVQGWILKPPNFDASKKYPLYLSIHGGPYAMYNSGFSISRLEHAANDYVVLYTNPRGSTGFGEEFSNAIGFAYPGRRDYDDLMAGVDTVIDKGYIDTDRLFIEGCSGGGVLTTWVIGHTTRFSAAVARCTVSDWVSMAGTADVNGWANSLFKTPYWEDPTDWLAHAPLMHVAKVKTPTLLITGDKDLRTPLPQAEQYYNALKQLGVPTRLIPMRGEYHGTGSIPSNWLRTQLYVRKWFEEYGPKKEQHASKNDE